MHYMTIHKVDSHRASPLNWGLGGAPSCPLYLEVWYSLYLAGPRSRCLVRTYGTDPYKSGMISTWMALGLGAWYAWPWYGWVSPIRLGTYKAPEDTCILTLPHFNMIMYFVHLSCVYHPIIFSLNFVKGVSGIGLVNISAICSSVLV